METMKDSGIAWIGQIPKTWEVMRLGNFFRERNEKVSDYEWEPLSVTKQGIVKQLESAAKSDAHDDRKKVCKNDFVINSRSDRKQSCGVSPFDGSVSLINIVLENRNLEPEYIEYLLKNYGFAEEFYRWGTGIVADLWSTKWERMKKIMLPVPKDNIEQRRIAHILDEKLYEIDAVLEKTQKTIEDYKKYRQAIITEVVTKGLNPDVSMRDSGIDYLGLIPTHWGVISVGMAFMFISGYAYKSERFCDETPYQVLRIGNVKNDNLILDEKKVFIDQEYAAESEKCRVLRDDILFTMTGTKGKRDYFYTMIVTSETDDRNLYINQRVGCFRKSNDEVFMPYYNYVLKLDKIKDYIFMFETGTANQGNLGIESISTTRMYLPPIEEQKEIVKYLDIQCVEIDKLIASKEALVEELEAYKKSVIYEYVTGKKEVV